ncbi:PAS domain-containing protein [Halobaculum sp. MBLA0143]|uniref:PAS domain-containing protein n=1 Tax=Halobaculum sp. MBLA0143 TaxID=3079933 RepID=UPI003523D641
MNEDPGRTVLCVTGVAAASCGSDGAQSGERQVQTRQGALGGIDATVVTVTDAATAVARLQAQSGVDLLVTDQRLPDGTGVDLIERVAERWSRTTTVLATADGDERVAADATAAGADAYVPLATPLGREERSEELRDRVTELLSDDDGVGRFERTLERTTDAVYAVDEDWRIEYIDDQMARRVGREPAEILGTVLWEEFPSVCGTELERTYRRAMETGEATTVETRLGEPYDYWVRARAFPDDDGLTVISREVTEQHERQRELERDETILQSLADPVFTVDETFEVQYANPAAATAVGAATVDDLVGRSIGSAVAGRVSHADARSFTDIVGDCLDDETDGDRECQLTVQTGDGPRHFDTTVTGLADADARRALIVARDVTDRETARGQLEAERDALRALQRVVADADASTGERLSRLLAVGCETLGLEVGLVSRVEDREYNVEAAHGPDVDVAAGDCYDLEETFCAALFEGDDSFAAETVSFRNAQEAGYDDHPAFHGEPLRAYAGVPLRVDGEPYGTVNFAARRPREEPFGEAENTFLWLVAELVGTELSRRASRRELERTNNRLASVVEATPSPVVETDPDGVVRRWNQAAEEVFGWPASTVCGEPDPTVPGEGSAAAERRARAADGERIRGEEGVRLCRDGSRLNVLVSAAPVTDADGEVEGVLTVLEDIGAQKRIESQLRALQETARKLTLAESVEEIGEITVEAAERVLDRSVTGVWEYDANTDALVPLAETEAAQELFSGIPHFERGEGLAWEAFDDDEVKLYDDVQSVERRYNSDTPIRSELLAPLSEVGLLVTGSTERREFTDADVDLFRVLASTAAAAIKRTNRETELRRQNERLDEFASVVAHDLRNPLAVADGFLEVAIETGETDQLSRVADAHDRIDQLIDDLLTLARGEPTVEDGQRVDLAGVAREAWGYVDTGEATLTVDPELGSVSGDRSRLSQLFENLFRNAADHAGPAAAVTVTATDEGFVVADDGPGIPPGERDRVLEHGVTTAEGGTGFGLSIVADTARAHGWTVDVGESAEGGARFVFES